jgi:hypothetical protein
MNFVEHFKFSIHGFSPNRTAYLLDLVSLAASPIHLLLPCELCVLVLGFALLNLLGVLVLCLLTPRSTGLRFLPLAIGFIVLVHHAFCMH